jgi:hypothetical protein
MRWRKLVEVANGTFMTPKMMEESPDSTRLVAEAVAVLRSELKEALWGLGPVFGKENLLRTCAEVIDEDFNADGPQTRTYQELQDARDFGGEQD